MIKNNSFTINNLKNVVFIGEHQSFKELIEINKKYKLKTLIITSPNQKKKLIKNYSIKFLVNLIVSLRIL